MLIDEARVGAKIKCGISSKWLEISTRKPFIWMKGTIIEVNNRNGHHSIVVNLWNRKFNIRIKNLMCFPKDEEYKRIKLCRNKIKNCF